MYVFFTVFFLVILLCFVWNYWRKACIIKKVCSMSEKEKCRLLDDIIHPLGYCYLPRQDIFITTFDAWQREFGYTMLYNCAAPFFNMVFDSEPVYFDYDNRTWLIEFWKGQYGINTGAEIGIYCADEIVPPGKRNRALFHTVPDEYIPHFTISLKRQNHCCEEELADVSMPHWWLAAFRMGCFSKPKQLSVDICIGFPNCEMLLAFTEALASLGYDACSMQVWGLNVCFSFKTALTPSPCGLLSRIAGCVTQLANRIFCRLFCFITRLFCSTLDKLVYLYFYLPFVFRRCLRLRRCRKCSKHRQKCRKTCNTCQDRHKCRHKGGCS